MLRLASKADPHALMCVARRGAGVGLTMVAAIRPTDVEPHWNGGIGWFVSVTAQSRARFLSVLVGPNAKGLSPSDTLLTCSILWYGARLLGPLYH